MEYNTSPTAKAIVRKQNKHLAQDAKNYAKLILTKLKGDTKHGDDLAKSQFRNLIQLLMEQNCFPPVRLWIEYQASRSATRKLWEPIHKEVIQALDENVRKRLGPQTDDDVLIEGARVTAGFLLQALSYEASIQNR